MSDISNPRKAISAGGRGTDAASIHADSLTPAQLAVHNNFKDSVLTLKKGLVRTIFHLGRIRELKIHRTLGYRTIGEYAADIAGFTYHQTREFLYLARKLPEYPQVAAALGDGTLSWSRAREICAKTTPDAQEVWVDAARRMPREALRMAITTADRSNTKPGGPDRTASPASKPPPMPPRTTREPTGPPPAPAPFHYVTLKFTPEEIARWATLTECMVRRSREPRETLVLQGLDALAGADAMTPDHGRGPGYLVVVLHCPQCGGAALPTNRGESPAPPALLQAALCDAIVEDKDAKRRRTLSPRQRRRALRRARYRCQAAGCANTQFLEIHHRRPAAGGGLDGPDNLVVLCWRCHRHLHEADGAAREVLRNKPP